MQSSAQDTVHLHADIVHFLLLETPAAPAREMGPEAQVIALPCLPGQVVNHPQQA